MGVTHREFSTMRECASLPDALAAVLDLVEEQGLANPMVWIWPVNFQDTLETFDDDNGFFVRVNGSRWETDGDE